MRSLESALDELSRASVLLVACDCDGTIAPIADRPELAVPDRNTLVAMRALAATPHTHVAVISGRALADLASIIGESSVRFYLVGSHGGEFDPGFARDFTEHQRLIRETLVQQVSILARHCPGAFVEEKPAGLAFHYRNADPSLAASVAAQIAARFNQASGIHVRAGKMVLELSIMETNKGDALRTIRARTGADACLFIGDDTTDEDALATLAGPDVGVRVGPGNSRAEFRVADTQEASRLLARLAESRVRWFESSAPPIQSHSLLSDQRTAALINESGRVVWMCVPRFDAESLFAELIGGSSAGYFEVRPADTSAAATCAYAGDSMVLQTQWPGMRVTDYLDCSGGRAFQRAGRTDLIRVIEGRARAVIRFAPRLNFGRATTRLQITPGGLVVEEGLDPLVLVSPGLNWRIEQHGAHQTAIADVEVRDQPLVLELRYGTASFSPAVLPEAERRRQTVDFWARWASSLTVPARHRPLVVRSALVLRALTYGPTGAIVAAATTSLPGHLGGVRNWDYRYCWPRDGAMSASALLRLGATGRAMRFLDWLLGVVERCESPDRLHPIYSVTGHHIPTEAEISGLPGYGGSRPVRVGNAAAHQVQLDVFGPIVDLVAGLAARGEALAPEHWRLVERMVEAVEHRWAEPDHGIWEARRSKRHHVHSKVMCWMTIDRAIAVATYLGHKRCEWPALRDAIADDLFRKGWHEKTQSFGAWYEDESPDAAVLWVGLSGLLPPGDPRWCSTVNHIERQLRFGPSVHRYHYGDGVAGVESGFHICTGWLIESLARIGRRDAADELLDQLAGLAGPTGLYSEQFDSRAQRAMGNFPQCYSHLALINALTAIS
ncbi:MAG: trehalose-phosphatase [Planctomycetes bacterium]|nr:trehalose-phosphatase [Planctomycetota bacterium]